MDEQVSRLLTLFFLTMLLAVVLAVVILLPPKSVLVALMVVFSAAGLALYGLIRLRDRAMSHVHRLMQALEEIQDGDAKAVLDAAQQRRDQDNDRSVENALVLAAAHTYLGHSDEAEALAHEALDTLTRTGTSGKEDVPTRMFCDFAWCALFDAWLIQGKFDKAAQYLEQHVNSAYDPVFVQILVAWGYFLAVNVDAARIALAAAVDPDHGEHTVTPDYRVMLLYMRHRLLGMRLPDARDIRDGVAEWTPEAERNAANPYGRRLRVILDDMLAVVAPDVS